MIWILLLSVLSSTVILLVFRFFGRMKIDLLPAIIGNYFMAAALGWIFFQVDVQELYGWILPALLLGVLFISMFLVMAKSTHQFGMGVTSVAVKMSVAIPVIAGFLLYNEKLNEYKLIGLVLGLIGLYLITPLKKSKQTEMKGIWMIPFLFFGSGMLDSVLKWTEHHYVSAGMEPQFSSTIFGFAALFGLLYYGFTMLREKKEVVAKPWLWGLVLGIPNFFSIYFLVKLLGIDGLDSSWVFPVNNLGIVLLSTLIGWIFFKEMLNWRIGIGFAISVVALYLLGLSL